MTGGSAEHARFHCGSIEVCSALEAEEKCARVLLCREVVAFVLAEMQLLMLKCTTLPCGALSCDSMRCDVMCFDVLKFILMI